MRHIILLTIILAIAAASLFGQNTGRYEDEVAKWREAHETGLRSDNGWLTLAGLFWLKEGTNTVGNGNEFDIRLTDSFAGERFGEIDLLDGRARLKVEEGIEAFNGDKRVTSAELDSDEGQKPTVIRTGSQTFYLIKRGERLGIRLKDKQSSVLRNFSGLHWFPVDSGLRVVASFEKFDRPQEVLVPNVLGGTFKYESPGVLRFRLGGSEYTLQPVSEGENLFIIFRDETSRSETYPAGRFLYTAKPVNGKVVLDFNKAENPPCAFTPFATCPLPPRQNRLKVAIRGGEKRFHK